jgi:hypothetical protein
MTNAVFWDMDSQLLTLFLARGFFYPEDGGDKFVRNLGSHGSTRRHIPEDGILHSHRREILKSHKNQNITLILCKRHPSMPKCWH